MSSTLTTALSGSRTTRSALVVAALLTAGMGGPAAAQNAATDAWPLPDDLWPPYQIRAPRDGGAGKESIKPIQSHVMKQVADAALELANGAVAHADELLEHSKKIQSDHMLKKHVVFPPKQPYEGAGGWVVSDLRNSAGDAFAGINSMVLVHAKLRSQRDAIGAIARHYAGQVKVPGDPDALKTFLAQQDREVHSINAAVDWSMRGREYMMMWMMASLAYPDEDLEKYQKRINAILSPQLAEKLKDDPVFDTGDVEAQVKRRRDVFMELAKPFAAEEKRMVDQHLALYQSSAATAHEMMGQISDQVVRFVDLAPPEWVQVPDSFRTYNPFRWPTNVFFPPHRNLHGHERHGSVWFHVRFHTIADVDNPHMWAGMGINDLYGLHWKVPFRPPSPETSKGYRGPPTLAFSMGRAPAVAQSGGPLSVGVRVTNRGKTGVAGVTLSVQLFDDGTGLPMKSWKTDSDHIASDGDGSFVGYVDSLEPNEAVDMVLTGDAREGERVLWVAQWDSRGAASGERHASGRITGRHVPTIFEVLPLEDQMQFERGVYLDPYPFVPDDDNLISTVQRRPKTRRLFIVGRNLPQKVGDQRVLTSEDPRVSYKILSLPNDDNQFWRESYQRAWCRYLGVRGWTPGLTQLQGLLVNAEIQDGVLPGETVLRLNNAEGRWQLHFGDLTGTISFVRSIGPRQIEVIDNAYFPESVRIAVTTNRELPLTAVPVDLLTSDQGFTKRNTYALTATRAPEYGPGVYLTPPIRLVDHRRAPGSPPASGETGELSLMVNRAELHLALAFARVNDTFESQSLAIPMNPPQAELRLTRTPAADTINHLWKDALMRAAACHKIKNLDWRDVDGVIVDEIWNLIVLTRKDHKLSQDVVLGHHAAMILLRDVFLVMTRKEIENLGKIRQDDRAVRGFLNYMRAFWLNEDFPVNRLRVTDPNGEETLFSLVASADNEAAAKEYSTAARTFTAEEIDTWRIKATKEALGKLQEAAAKSVEMAADIEDKEIEDLLKLTGFSFDAVRSHLLTKLMRLEESTATSGARHLSWVPDDSARYWVREIAKLAAAVKQQQAKSNADTDLLMAAAAVLTMPLTLSESAAVAFIAFGIDALDLAITAGSEIPEYLESRWEQQFSEGAAITIGYERNKVAIANAKGWVSTTFGVGMSGLGAVGGVFEVVDSASKIRLARQVSRGRELAQSVDAGRLGSLSKRELDDFLVFSIDAKARALAKGSDALDAAQRRALEVIEIASAERKAAGAAKRLDDIPAAGVEVARMDVDPGSGAARIAPEPGIRLRKPVAAGSSIRGPPKAPRLAASPLRIDSSSPNFDMALVRAAAGTPVIDPRPFGMLDDAMRQFQKVVDTFQLRVRVRDANPSSMQWLRLGHPPKHVKLKSKTINDLDVTLGAKPGSQGMVGYFLPNEPPNFNALSKLRPPPEIVSRYRKRLKEYYNNFKDIERLKQKGLVSVENGVVIDRGLASTRLDPRSGKLVPIRGPPEGTGKGFTGDYDMWDVTHPDGSRIITDPRHPRFRADPRFHADALRRKKELLRELGGGSANTKHGPHKDWEPTAERDLEIDQTIRDGHRGKRLPDGSIVPLPKSKGLLEFQPNAQPRVSYEYEAPPTIERGPGPDGAAKSVSFTDVDGQVMNLPLGARLGSPGSTSVAYEHAKLPDTRVVRVTTEKPGHPAVLLDDFGRRVLKKDISSPHIRAAKEFDRWDIADESQGFTRVSVVERVVPVNTAVESTGGVMTLAQQKTFESALRDLNRQGYVWLDNKWDNFGFVENANGSLSVVVFDTGGIFKVSGNADLASRTARQMQRYVNGPLRDFAPRGTVMPLWARAALRKAEIVENHLPSFDMAAMKLTDVSQLKFNAISGEQFDYVGSSFAR